MRFILLPPPTATLTTPTSLVGVPANHPIAVKLVLLARIGEAHGPVDDIVAGRAGAARGGLPAADLGVYSQESTVRLGVQLMLVPVHPSFFSPPNPSSGAPQTRKQEEQKKKGQNKHAPSYH